VSRPFPKKRNEGGVVTLSQTERNLPTIANIDARDFKDLACWLIVQIGPISLNVTTPGWCLSVSDNGSGFGEAGVDGVHIGLGTSIIEALAQQLNAEVQKSAGPTGTTVSITASAASGWPQ
jgi:two-component sensor histidine kinase